MQLALTSKLKKVKCLCIQINYNRKNVVQYTVNTNCYRN